MIYCVEDDDNIRELVVYTLDSTGLPAKGFPSGKEFKTALKNELPELILLDIMLPGEDGMQLLSEVRKDTKTKNIPVIMLTAKGAEYDKVAALDLGADDYVTKPFSVPELLARIKTNVRRVSTTNQLTKKEYTFQDIRLDTIEKKVFRGENYIRLGPTEFRILKLLIANPRHVFSREDLLREVWGNSVYVETRTVDVHIRRLRKALNEFGADYIRTIRATGYSIDDHEVEAE